ncbi:MAG: GNAT family N-acetyltransferase [Candidatus Nanopelagicaceae bacterium]|nr:GNAT family N-acetyltransferase [Candidatus Nanopelagicaceae bacterium]
MSVVGLEVVRGVTVKSEVLNYLATAPEVNCFLSSRAQLLEKSKNSTLLIYRNSHSEIEGVTYIGGNLIPAISTRAALLSLVDHLRSKQYKFSSIVGESRTVFDLWELISHLYSEPRAIRQSQPLLSLRGVPKISGNPLALLATLADLDEVVEVGITMFTAEVGEVPDYVDYRSRSIELIEAGRTLISRDLDNGKIIFKSDIGAIGAGAYQIHGVWVDPAHRGKGLGSAGVATLVEYGNRFAPIASLYVNDFNHAARASYHKVGFEKVAELATIFF